MSAPTAPTGISILLGPPLIGSWANTMLYMAEIFQASTVFASDQSWKLKLFVGIVMAVETVGTAAACAHLYINCVIHWGNVEAELSSIYWPYALVNGASAVTAAIVHSYLLRRFWLLSRNIYLTVPLVLTAILALIGAIMSVVSFIQYPLIAQNSNWVVPTRIWEISSAIADIGLAVALVWKLRSVRSSFQSTQSLLRRLIFTAVETGVTTSSLFIVIVLLLLSSNGLTVAVALELCIGRAYANTLLYNINLRQRVTRGSSGGRTSDGPGAPSGVSLSEIHFVRRVEVHKDTHGEISRSPTSDIEALKRGHGDASLYPSQAGDSAISQPF